MELKGISRTQSEVDCLPLLDTLQAAHLAPNPKPNLGYYPYEHVVAATAMRIFGLAFVQLAEPVDENQMLMWEVET